MQLESWRAVTYLFRPQYRRLRVQILLLYALTTNGSQMDEMKVINVSKRYFIVIERQREW